MDIKIDKETSLDTKKKLLGSEGGIKEPFAFKHWVSFDFGLLVHPLKGQVHIKSKFPRLPAAHTRALISEDECKSIMQKQTVWWKKFWKEEMAESKVEKLVNAVVYFALYTDPFPPLHSKIMELYANYNIWVFWVDDELEAAIRAGMKPEDLQKVCQQFLDILNGKFDDPELRKGLKDTKGHPGLKGTLECLLDIHLNSLKHIPWYNTHKHDLIKITEKYLDAFIWCCIDKPDDRYSAEAFKYWRGIDCANSMCVEYVVMLRQIQVPERVRRHPCFQKVEEMCGLSGWINDVLGIRKDFLEPDLGNLVGYHHKKGSSLEDAVQKVCDVMERELSDYVLFKEVLNKAFPNDENMMKYFECLEANVDGNWPMYKHSIRYYAVADCITLT